MGLKPFLEMETILGTTSAVPFQKQRVFPQAISAVRIA
jgi:hypothetical protein